MGHTVIAVLRLQTSHVLRTCELALPWNRLP